MNPIEVRGERLQLLPERAVFWPAASTLFLADPHFGKTESFRRLGVPVPSGATSSTLARLSRVVEQTAAEQLVILGDFWHAAAGVTDEVLASLRSWKDGFESLTVHVILGNHDRSSGGVSPELGFEVHGHPIVNGPFVAAHYPEADPAGYVLAGHLHPGYTVRGRGRQAVSLPCFWFGPEVAVLPAFGEFTGLATVAANPGDQVIVIANEELIVIEPTPIRRERSGR